MDISQKIEALLFWKGEPVSIGKLASWLGLEKKIVVENLKKLEQDLNNRALVLIWNDDEVMLGVNKKISSLIDSITKEEISRDIGKAGLETLSIILYQGPISRAEIDNIRGVNSQFILRNLLVRGLIERQDNPSDSRSYLYKPSMDLLSQLGISKISELPEYDKVREDIERFKKENEELPEEKNN